MYARWFIEPELNENFAGYILYLFDTEGDLCNMTPFRTEDDAYEMVAQLQMTGELVV